MIKRISIAVAMWVVALYLAQAAPRFFGGEDGSGGETKGYAEDISCSRNWWAFGALWSCDATIVANDGKRYSYHNGNSSLTPADVGTRVPMTNNRVRTSRSLPSSVKWGVTEPREPVKALVALSIVGFPGAAFVTTVRMFRKRKPVEETGQTSAQPGGTTR